MVSGYGLLVTGSDQTNENEKLNTSNKHPATSNKQHLNHI